MTTAKQSWFKRSLSVLMVIAMAASAFTANAFSVKAKAESYPEGSREVRRLEAPVEDGVYTASIELMNAAQGIDFRRPQKTSPILERFLCEYRKEVPFVKDDIVMYKEIHKTVAFLSRTKFDY